MKLRQKSKRDQTLDAVASVAKTWSEWRLGEKVAKTATKAAKKTGKTSKKAKQAGVSASKRTPVKIAGVVALLGGIGAAVAKKLSGGKAEPLYTPPGPAADMAAPPPSPVAVGDLAQDAPPPATASVPPTAEPAVTASTEVPEPEPTAIVIEDLAADEPVETEETPPADEAAGTDDAPDPDDLVSDTASVAASDDKDSKQD
jgi:hypothetical protein